MVADTALYRFLFITADEFPTYRPDVEVLFGKELLGRGHRIDWIAPAAEPQRGSRVTRWRGCRLWLGPGPCGDSSMERIRRHLGAFRNELRVFRLARDEGYDFIQVKDAYFAALLGLLAARWNGTRFFYWHSFPFPEASLLQAKTPGARYPRLYWLRGRLLERLLYRLICPAADHVFVQSLEMKRQMVGRGVPAAKMTAVPMGIDVDNVEASTPVCSAPALEAPALEAPALEVPAPEARSVVYLGALDRIRGLEFLIKAFARVARRHPDVELYLVGDSRDPDARACLVATARQEDVGTRVCITGFLPREAAFEHVRRASVCVSPLPETPVFTVSSPTKVVEYLALGKPVVANDISDTRTVLERSGGGLCVPYEIGAFADALQQLLEHPRQAREMGERGRAWVVRHRSYGVLADEVEQAYARALGRGVPAAALGADPSQC